MSFKNWLASAGVPESSREVALKAMARAFKHLDDEDFTDPLMLDLYRRSLTPALRRTFDLGWSHYRAFAGSLAVEGMAEPPRLSPVRWAHVLGPDLLWVAMDMDMETVAESWWGARLLEPHEVTARDHLLRAYEWQTGLALPEPMSPFVPKHLGGKAMRHWSLDYAMRSVDRVGTGFTERHDLAWQEAASARLYSVARTREAHERLVAERTRIERSKGAQAAVGKAVTLANAGDLDGAFAAIMSA